MKWATASLFVLLLVAPATADQWDALDDATLERLATDLRAGRDAQALVETQRAEIAVMREQIAALREALAEATKADTARTVALALAEDRDQRRQEGATLLLKVLEEHRALLERAEKRIESLEKRQFWMAILGPIGMLLGVMLGVF